MSNLTCPNYGAPITKGKFCNSTCANTFNRAKESRPDPTPEQIAEQSAVYRERHLEKMRGMK